MCGEWCEFSCPASTVRHEVEYTILKIEWRTDRWHNDASSTYAELGHRKSTYYTIAIDGHFTNTTGVPVYGADFIIDCSVNGEHIYHYEHSASYGHFGPDVRTRMHFGYGTGSTPVYSHGIRVVGGFFNGYMEESLAFEQSRDDADLPDRWWNVHQLKNYGLYESEWVEIEPPDVTTTPDCDVTVLLSPDENYTN